MSHPKETKVKRPVSWNSESAVPSCFSTPGLPAVSSRYKPMNITVILCTFNRSQSLVRALGSVVLSRLPEAVTWEVLVVDNNSCDQTREVVADFCARYPGRFRYVFESEPGKSNALNRGVAEAHGDVLAFMDDDVIVDPSGCRC